MMTLNIFRKGKSVAVTGARVSPMAMYCFWILDYRVT
jgi:hypothetical protein